MEATDQALDVLPYVMSNNRLIHMNPLLIFGLLMNKARGLDDLFLN